MTEPREANYVWNKDIQFAPIRPLSEFLTDTSRYEVCTVYILRFKKFYMTPQK